MVVSNFKKILQSIINDDGRNTLGSSLIDSANMRANVCVSLYVCLKSTAD